MQSFTPKFTRSLKNKNMRWTAFKFQQIIHKISDQTGKQFFLDCYVFHYLYINVEFCKCVGMTIKSLNAG